MTLDAKIRLVCRTNAVINWTIATSALLGPQRLAGALGAEPPNYPFMLQLWMGLVFMFGCMFWETGRDVRGKAALLKYNWIEKTITALAVTYGFATGQVPERLMILVILTNWAWILPLLILDRKMARLRHA